MPQATRCAGSSRTPLAARKTTGLYELGGGPRSSLRLWRIGAATSTLVTRDAPPTTQQGAPSALAAANAGRLWVAWASPRPHHRSVVELRRTGASPRRLGAVTTVPIPRSWSNVRRLDIAPDRKRVEILAVVTRNSNEVGLLHAAAEPSLSVTARPRRFAHGQAGRIRVKVTDAGVGARRPRAAGRPPGPHRPQRAGGDPPAGASAPTAGGPGGAQALLRHRPGPPAGPLALLRRRAHEDLVDVHVRRLGDRVHDRAGDVVGLERVLGGRSSKNGVSTMPGAMSVTRTPVPLSSWRADSPMPVTAHFVAE